MKPRQPILKATPVRRASRVLLAGAGVVLLLAALFQMRLATVIEAHPRVLPLSEFLPMAMAGWSVRDKPVADTEEMKRAVGEMLNYDEAILRFYERDRQQVSVYVAYWRPGRVHPRLIAQHTPDVCWTGAGWRMSAVRRMSITMANGQQTVPGEARFFEQGEHRLHVVYWHLVGGSVGHGTDARGLTFFRYLGDDLRRGQREQYFIRVSSTRPLDELRGEPLAEAIWGALATMGLRDSI